MFFLSYYCNICFLPEEKKDKMGYLVIKKCLVLSLGPHV